MVTQRESAHRFALSAGAASLVALAIGVLVGVVVATSIFPDAQGLQVGVQYGLILGVAAGLAVFGMRAAVGRGAPSRLAAPLAVVAAAVLSAVAFALTQRSEAMLGAGAVFGAIVGIPAVVAALIRGRRPAAGR